MSEKKLTTQKGLVQYAKQNGLVYVWALTRRQRQLSHVFIGRQRQFSPDQYELVEVCTARGLERAMLFPKAVLQTEFEGKRGVLATKVERLKRGGSKVRPRIDWF